MVHLEVLPIYHLLQEAPHAPLLSALVSTRWCLNIQLYEFLFCQWETTYSSSQVWNQLQTMCMTSLYFPIFITSFGEGSRECPILLMLLWSSFELSLHFMCWCAMQGISVTCYTQKPDLGEDKELSDLVRTASSSGLLLLYPEIKRCSFSSVIGRLFKVASAKFFTNTCLQKGAYPSTRSSCKLSNLKISSGSCWLPQ